MPGCFLCLNCQALGETLPCPAASSPASCILVQSHCYEGLFRKLVVEVAVAPEGEVRECARLMVHSEAWHSLLDGELALAQHALSSLVSAAAATEQSATHDFILEFHLVSS